VVYCNLVKSGRVRMEVNGGVVGHAALAQSLNIVLAAFNLSVLPLASMAILPWLVSVLLINIQSALLGFGLNSLSYSLAGLTIALVFLGNINAYLYNDPKPLISQILLPSVSLVVSAILFPFVIHPVKISWVALLSLLSLGLAYSSRITGFQQVQSGDRLN